MKLGLAALRLIVGGLFMGHGLQKLAGWFGGGGLEGTGKAFESMNLRPGRVHAGAAGTTETVGGAMLAGGLLTPIGASLLSGTMITAIRKVHARNGLWASNGGYEYNLVLIAIVFAVTDVGPGEWSLDNALDIERSGRGWALAQLGAALVGSAAAIAIGAHVPAKPAAPIAGAGSSNGAVEHAAEEAGEGPQAQAATDS
jgi:putative oxidoreductase